MISELHIENFRRFQAYSVRDLARVNLLVGPNNCGKTTILEGLEFLLSRGDVNALIRVAGRRAEIDVRINGAIQRRVDAGLFFFERRIAAGTQFVIDGGTESATASIREGETPVGPYFFRVEYMCDGNQLAPFHGVPLEGRRWITDIDILADNDPCEAEPNQPPPRVDFINMAHLRRYARTAAWNRLTLSNRKGELAETLKIIDPDVDEINILPDFGGPGNSQFAVKLKSRPTPVLLGSMGDGTRNLLALGEVLVGGAQTLLIDEIDTGIHYSTMAELWAVVVKRAIAADLQIFATTHSWDCIEGLSSLCEQQPELQSHIAIHKITRELAHAVTFSGESVAIMRRGQVDPR